MPHGLEEKPDQERDQEKDQDVLESMRIDEMADFHKRLSTLESSNLRLSRRVTHLEDGTRGHHSDDPLSGILSPGFMWAMAALTLAPLVIEAIKQWRSSSS